MRLIYGEQSGNCLCSRSLEEEEVKLMVKRISGKDSLWNGIAESCDITDKSFASFTSELNKMFTKYGFKTCIDKISFLAQAAHETGGFQQTKEEKSSHASSTSTYKGRGLIQITGNLSDGVYNEAGLYKKYADSIADPLIESNPDLISQKLNYAVDVSGWYFAKMKKVPKWGATWNKYDNVRKKKVAHFSEGLGKTLLELAPLINQDSKYFWLQSKILNGYSKKHYLEVDPKGWVDRKKMFNKLSAIFRFNTECVNNPNTYDSKERASWIEIAYGELWTEEIVGKKHNPRVLEYHASAGLTQSHITDDGDWPWCSSFACWVFKNSKEYTGKITAKATNWQNWGKEDSKDKPMYGALAVIDWGENDNGKGHVGFVVNVDGNSVYLLGGNQTGGDKNTKGRVCIGKYDKSVIDYFRIPANYEPKENDYIYDEIKTTSQGFESLSTTR